MAQEPRPGCSNASPLTGRGFCGRASSSRWFMALARSDFRLLLLQVGVQLFSQDFDKTCKCDETAIPQHRPSETAPNFVRVRFGTSQFRFSWAIATTLPRSVFSAS